MESDLIIRRHPRARRVKLRVHPDGVLEIIAPPEVPRRRVMRIVERQRAWVERARRRAAARRLPPSERGPLPTLLRLDAERRRLAVCYRSAEHDGWRWSADRLRVALADAEPARARAVLVDALKQRARAVLEPRLMAMADGHGLRVARVGWRNQKSRWGSCSTRGHLSLNVRLLFMPPAAVDYVFAHELAHLRHPDHSPAFWRRVGALMPGFEAARRELRASASRVPEWLL